ncbi:MAG: glycosyltransferase [Bacteroidota bacterium]
MLLIIPELSMGGAQRSISSLSLELAKMHQVWLVIFNKNNDIAYSYGGELLSLDVVAGRNWFHKLNSFVLRVIRLRKLKKKLNIDVSISFLEGADYINILSRLTDKTVLSVRGSKRHDETMVGRFSWLRNKILIPWLYSKAHRIVTVNHGIAHELENYYGLKKSKFVIIGNFYNTDEIIRLSTEPKSPKMNRLYDDSVLITTGRLAPEKGLKPLVKIFHRLKQKKTSLRLILIGDGPVYIELVELCEELGLVLSTTSDFDALPDVVLLRNQSNVFKYLKGATLYLMNSSSEGFPNGLAEAMICKVPVVSTDCPYGPREILAPEFSFSGSLCLPYISQNGVLMPEIKNSEDETSWVEMLTFALERRDAMLQLAERAYERISFCNQESILAKWNGVILEAI